MFTESKYMTEKAFRAVVRNITEVRRVNWDVIGNENNPEEVHVILDTDQGEMIFVCPHPWKMDNDDLFGQGAACGLLLSRVMAVLGLPMESFISPLEDGRASNNQLVNVVNRIRNAVNRGQNRGQSN